MPAGTAETVAHHTVHRSGCRPHTVGLPCCYRFFRCAVPEPAPRLPAFPTSGRVHKHESRLGGRAEGRHGQDHTRGRHGLRSCRGRSLDRRSRSRPPGHCRQLGRPPRLAQSRRRVRPAAATSPHTRGGSRAGRRSRGGGYRPQGRAERGRRREGRRPDRRAVQTRRLRSGDRRRHPRRPPRRRSRGQRAVRAERRAWRPLLADHPVTVAVIRPFLLSSQRGGRIRSGRSSAHRHCQWARGSDRVAGPQVTTSLAVASHSGPRASG